MTELILKNKIERQKLDSMIVFLKSWGIDVEVRTTATTKKGGAKGLFAKSFGMWEGRDMDIRQIRQKAYERRTKSHDDGTL